MYRKVLVPLDGSSEPEKVLPLIQDSLDSESEVILLNVIQPMGSQTIGQMVLTGSQREEAEKDKVMTYLRGVAHKLDGFVGRFHCEVIVSRSVAEGITSYATQNGIDLIAMYTHDRKGLARLIRGSIAAKVQNNSPTEVRTFRPRELAETAP